MNHQERLRQGASVACAYVQSRQTGMCPKHQILSRWPSLQNFVRTNSWESYTSNAGVTIHLYDGHFCTGECTNYILVALGLQKVLSTNAPILLQEWSDTNMAPLMRRVAALHGVPMLTQLCLMQARTLDLCLQRRARSQVHLRSFHTSGAKQ